MIALKQDIDYSYTKFNSKELFRAFRELSAIEFIVYLTMVRLITQYNSKKNFRKIPIPNILDELPINISLRSLNKYLKSLLDKHFITKFLSPEDRVNVYSLAQTATNQNYSLVENYILTDICSLINDAMAFKVYMLIFAGLILFKDNESFKKSLNDIAKMVGLKPTKGIRDSVSLALKSLETLNLIESFAQQKHRFQTKQISFTVNLWWREQLSLEEVELEDSKQPCEKPQINNPEQGHQVEVVQLNQPQSADLMMGECKSDDTYTLYIKENELIKKNESKRISDGITIEKRDLSTTKIDNNLLIFKFKKFNYYGLDKLDNPMTEWSINSVLKHSDITLNQVQLSTERFSSYINSSLCIHSFNDPVAVLCTHLRNKGEYVPPEHYLEQAHKLKYKPYKKDDYAELIGAVQMNAEQSMNQKPHYDGTLDENELVPTVRENKTIDQQLIKLAKNKISDLCSNLRLGGVIRKQLIKNHVENAIKLIENNIPITIENLGSVVTMV